MSKNKRYTLETFLSLLDNVKRKTLKRKKIFELLDVAPKETTIIKYEKNYEIHYNIKIPFFNSLCVKETELTKSESKKIKKALEEVTVISFEKTFSGDIIDML